MFTVTLTERQFEILEAVIREAEQEAYEDDLMGEEWQSELGNAVGAFLGAVKS